MTLQRGVYAVHSWTGLLTGWLLFALCLTGTLVVYKFPLKALSNPAMVDRPAADLIGPDGALAGFRAQHPEERPHVVAFPSDIYSIHQYSVVAVGPAGDEHRYWVHPVTGSVRAELQSDFADFVQRLHANFYMGQTGRWIVGIFGVLMAVSLVTGLIFHWRRIRRDATHLRLGGHPRKAWSDLHKFTGVWAFPFHLVIALTGAWLGLEVLFDIRASDASPIEIEGEGVGRPLAIAQIVARARTLRPDFAPTHVNFTNFGAAGSTVRVQGDLPGHRFVQRGQTMLVFDADSGRHLQTVDRTEQGLGRRVLAMVRPLHYGYFSPRWSEFLYFLLGTASTLLALSGCLIWAERNKRKHHPRAADAVVTRMERANAGVMGGLLVALAVMAVLNGLSRIPAAAPLAAPLGGFGFLGSQDLLSGRPVAAELPLLALVWAGTGFFLFRVPPLAAWRGAILMSIIALLLLPLLGAAFAGSWADFFSRGAGEAAGYSLYCVALAGAGALVLRRLVRSRADAAPRFTARKASA